jgi:hypothetical protein
VWLRSNLRGEPRTPTDSCSGGGQLDVWQATKADVASCRHATKTDVASYRQDQTGDERQIAKRRRSPRTVDHPRCCNEDAHDHTGDAESSPSGVPGRLLPTNLIDVPDVEGV